MDIVSLKAETRTPHGKRTAARLRRGGKLPAIIYGHQQTPAPIALERHEVERHLERGVHIVHLDVDGKRETCLIKEVQYDPLGIEALHVDFARVDLTERIRVKVPLEFRGQARGATEGGIVSQQLTDLDIECLATAIPDTIRVPINDLGLDQVYYVRDLKLPEGVRAVNEPDTAVVICRVLVSAPVAEAAPEQAATEPEVITRAKPKEDEGAAEEAKAP
jgi:large subunit ribosomal protein L25